MIRYDVILKGGPLHDRIVGYNHEMDDLPLKVKEHEIILSFRMEGNDKDYVTSNVNMFHTYVASRLRNEDGLICYFYMGTETGQRNINLERTETSPSPQQKDTMETGVVSEVPDVAA